MRTKAEITKDFTGVCQIWLSKEWVHPEGRDSIPPSRNRINEVVEQLGGIPHFDMVDQVAVKVDLYRKFGRDAKENKPKPQAHEIEELGSMFWQENGALMGCPIRYDGEPDLDSAGEVTAPESQEALDLINDKLNTFYIMSDFPGR